MANWTRVELEQLKNSREYQDRYGMGSVAETSVDFNGDFNYVLSQIRQIIYGPIPTIASGVGNWYDVVPVGLNQLNAVSGTSSSTWTQVFNNGLGVLNVSANNGSVRMTDGKFFRFHNNLGNNAIFEVLANSGIFMRKVGHRAYRVIPSEQAVGATITLPAGVTYTTGDSKFRNLRIYRNGVLLLPGSGVTSTNENYNDYREVTSSTIVTNRSLNQDEILEFHVTG